MGKKRGMAVFWAFLLLMGAPVFAAPIISVTGDADSFALVDLTHVVAVGWNQPESVTADISLSFLDPMFLVDGPTGYSAFLVDAIGSGVVNEQASREFTAGPDFAGITLFSNFLLAAGPHFLVVGLDSDQVALFPEGNWGATDPLFNPDPVFTSPGVNDLGQFFAQDEGIAGYLPASTFFEDTSGGTRLLYEVQPVPEPSTLLLVLGPAICMMAIGLRRRRQA